MVAVCCNSNMYVRRGEDRDFVFVICIVPECQVYINDEAVVVDVEGEDMFKFRIGGNKTL